MKTTFAPYLKGFKQTGKLIEDVPSFYMLHNDIRTLEHTLKVKDEAARIAGFLDPNLLEKSIAAALLHDISNVIPVPQMLHSAEELGIEILDDERKYARSVHQKLSAVMAREIFGITDADVLQAIESHTTYRSTAEMVDKILFVADKISWELPGEHQHLKVMREQVFQYKIDEAILTYLDFIWDQRDKLKLVHPWLIEARNELKKKVTSYETY
jgi:HD superfamily phosphohydrolase YqeK